MREILFEQPNIDNDQKKTDSEKGHFDEAGNWTEGEKNPRGIIFESNQNEQKKENVEEDKVETKDDKLNLDSERQTLIKLTNKLDDLERIKKLKFDLSLDLNSEEKSEYEKIKAEQDVLLLKLRKEQTNE